MTSTKAVSRRIRASPPTQPPRLIIEHLKPSVEGGRYPAKRVVGDDVTIEAIVYRDGHDWIAGRIRFRPPQERRWHTAPMAYERDLDRCRGAIHLDQPGIWTYTVEAWTDRFASWEADLAKRLAAGFPVTSELLAGAALIAEAAQHARGADRDALRRLGEIIRDASRPAVERAEAAMSPECDALMTAHLAPEDLTQAEREYQILVHRRNAGFAAWYEMFPRSQGTVPGQHASFDQAARRLPEIAALGFDVVYLPPIHPIGRSHRKGPNNTLTAGPADPGSPWAIGSEHGGHTAVEPALGTVEDFERFVRRAEEAGLEVALDYALQCSPDHPWVKEHPDWFFVRPDGTIQHAENPPKKYEDIYPLDFWCEDFPALWEACKEILDFWIARGVKTFRVDNPHTKPFAFWEWLLGSIARTHPDVIFLSEAFTRPARMRGLAKIGFHQSYTYFTWRNSASELREYLTELSSTEMAEYFRPNFFANTPDILHEYLQHGGRPAFRARLVLAATLSPLYGIYSGYELCENTPVRPGSEEYLHSEKYEIRVRDWNAPGHIKDDIVTLNRIRREHPALQRLDNVTFPTTEGDHLLVYHKHAPGDDLLIVVNLDPHGPRDGMVHVPLAALGLTEEQLYQVEDLLTGKRYSWRGTRNYVRLDPNEQMAHVLRVIPPASGA